MEFSDQLIHLDKVSSTNELLLRDSDNMYPDGTALLARVQTAGRGRAGREWCSEPGGMYLSTVWTPKRVQGLALLGALCLLEMCHHEWALKIKIRWPNDLVLDGKKLGGVLPQVRFFGSKPVKAVMGIGLNVNQDLNSFNSELVKDVTTLASHLDEPLVVKEIARSFLGYWSRELELFDKIGCEQLCLRCQENLEGLDDGLVAQVFDEQCSSGGRVLGIVSGLGPTGELLFEGGQCLDRLGPTERLRFSPL